MGPLTRWPLLTLFVATLLTGCVTDSSLPAQPARCQWPTQKEINKFPPYVYIEPTWVPCAWLGQQFEV